MPASKIVSNMFKAFHKMLYSKRLSILTGLLLLPFNGYASGENQQIVDQLVKQAVDNSLWKKSEWLNLLHYNPKGNGYLSQVDDENFFYAEHGKESPQEELTATLKQLFKYAENPNQQTQCRYIARSEWLINQLDIKKSLLPLVNCEEYLEWYEQAGADSITLVFPAYHLNSPSSMFGHTLLRLDKSEISNSEWISFAVNFGADTSSDDASLMYAYRGLAGGYPGLFITEPYFKKIQEYNRIEHRDIWEYRLNLTALETDRLIKHLWELKTINFDYYFFDENCSYRLLELIEVARPGLELTDEFILTAIPVDTVRSIEKAQLIESVKYRPAQVTEIQFLLNELPEDQQDIVLQLSKDFSISTKPEFNLLSPAQQKKIVSISYKYLRYQNAQKSRNPAIVKLSYQLLNLLNSYPAEINIDSSIPPPIFPEQGHKSKRFSMGFGESQDKQYMDIGFKMSFHDLEDNKNGFLQGAQINLGSINLRVKENESLKLERLVLVDIFSLTPRNNFFEPMSWMINTGFERQLTDNQDQLVYQLTGGGLVVVGNI